MYPINPPSFCTQIFFSFSSDILVTTSSILPIPSLRDSVAFRIFCASVLCILVSFSQYWALQRHPNGKPHRMESEISWRSANSTTRTGTHASPIAEWRLRPEASADAQVCALRVTFLLAATTLREGRERKTSHWSWRHILGSTRGVVWTICRSRRCRPVAGQTLSRR